MSKNIEMNYKISDGYEVLYPITKYAEVLGLQEELDKKLSLAGGVMTGDLILNGEPSQTNQAVNLGYLNSILVEKMGFVKNTYKANINMSLSGNGNQEQVQSLNIPLSSLKPFTILNISGSLSYNLDTMKSLTLYLQDFNELIIVNIYNDSNNRRRGSASVDAFYIILKQNDNTRLNQAITNKYKIIPANDNKGILTKSKSSSNMAFTFIGSCYDPDDGQTLSGTLNLNFYGLDL